MMLQPAVAEAGAAAEDDAAAVRPARRHRRAIASIRLADAARRQT